MLFTITFILLFALVLWISISLTGKVWVKAFVIFLSIFFSTMTFTTIESFYGWPTNQAMPSEFRVHWVVVSPPSKEGSSSGWVYYWAEEVGLSQSSDEKGLLQMIFNGARGDKIRAYKIPYSEGLHAEADYIVQKLLRGELVVGSKRPLDNEYNDYIINDENDGMSNSLDSLGVNFYSLPSSGPPKQ